jgi:hypothetical protein
MKYQASIDRGKHSSGSLEKRHLRNQKHSARASSTIFLGNYSIIRACITIVHSQTSQTYTTSITMEENRERQAAELTLLTTMYPSEFSWRNNPPPDLETSSTITTDPNFTLTIHRT